MKIICFISLLFFCGIINAQILTVRIVDIDNRVLPGTIVTLDNSYVYNVNCMGVVDIPTTPGMHNIKLYNTKTYPDVDNIFISTNDTTVYIILTPRWCLVKFIISTTIPNLYDFEINLDNVTTHAYINNVVTLNTKPGLYNATIITGIDTIIIPIKILNDTIISYTIKPIEVKNDTDTLAAVFNNTNITNEIYPAIIEIYTMAGVKLQSLQATSDNYSLDLPIGMYIIITRPLGSNTTLTSKVLICP